MTSTLALLVALTVPQAAPATPLQLHRGDHICIVGNTLAERMQHDGWLETLLQARHPKRQLVIRNLGFSGDEITVRLRSRGFGSPDEHLTLHRADVIFAFFGYNESFAADAGLAGFRRDLTEQIRHWQSQRYNGESAPRVVILSPIAHENLDDPNLPDGSANNARLARYTAAMASVAATEGATFVDLFSPTLKRYATDPEPLTINGIHLNERGNRAVAQLIDEALFGGNGASCDALQELRAAVCDKNDVWFHRYRTVDGYSIFGGRGDLQFVGNQTNRDVTERELHVLDEMTALRDRRIWAVAQGGNLALDDDATSPFLTVETNLPGKGPHGEHLFLGGEEAIAKMTVADGMEVGLFASEDQFPELVNPVQVAVDTRGRLWVAVWPTYPHWKPKTPRNDKLLILEDKDGDGRADSCVVFADGLHCPTGFEFYNGGVYLAQAPDLMFLADTDGDDAADVRRLVLHGLGSADTHHTSNSFTLDPGGALYFQEGTFHHTQVESPWGPPRRVANGAVFRYEPRSDRFDVYTSYGFANPHGHVFDRWGQDFVTDGTGAIPYWGTSFSGHVEFPHKHGGAPTVYRQRTRPCAATELLSSARFPDRNQGTWLITNVIGFRGILQYQLVDDGAGFRGVEVEPIVSSSDLNFRPVDLEVGGDGALYFVDWHNPLIGHMQHNLRDPSRDVSHGRVYRVTCPDIPASPPAVIAGQPIGALLDLLKSRENRVRYRAKIELSARPSEDVITAVKAWTEQLDSRDPDYEHHLLEALWVHQHHNEIDEALLQRLLASPEPRARAAAVRVLCYWRDRISNPLSLLRRAAQDDHPRVRIEAVRACSFIPSAPSAEVALLAATKPLDRYLEYTLDETIKTLGPQWKTALAAGRPFAADNPAGAAYVLARVATDELTGMVRNEAVDRALLERGGIPVHSRREALAGLADAHGTRPLDELIAELEDADHPSTADLSRLLADWDPVQLRAARERLVTMASAGPRPVRAAAYAAWMTADESPTAAWRHGSSSAAGLMALLDATQLIDNPEILATLYPVLRPLLTEVPDFDQQRRAGVAYAYYAASHFSDVELATLDSMTPAATGEVATFTLAIPGRRADSFAVKYSASVQVENAGPYTFTTRSDDGSRLYVDGRQVVDNDGLHSATEKSGTIQLAGGSHELVVTYYDNGGADALAVMWQGPGMARRALTSSDLFIDSAGALRRAAILAIGRVPGRDAEKFADFATLLRRGDHRNAAVTSMMAIAAANWPPGEAQDLARSFTTIAGETPVAQRNTEDYQRLIELGTQLAGTLPDTEAERVRTDLHDLDLQVIRIGTVAAAMRFDKTSFSVVAGKPVKIILENSDMMPHNLLVAAPGSLQEVGSAADKMAADPQGFAKSFVPDSDKVLAAGELLQAGETGEIDFTAPGTPGDYPYICTFPGHWRTMNGVMVVLPDQAK